MKPYREVLMKYMASPIHVVRRLTSLSIVATVERLPELCTLTEQFSQSIVTETQANVVHSQLLALMEMVLRLSERQWR